MIVHNDSLNFILVMERIQTVHLNNIRLQRWLCEPVRYDLKLIRMLFFLGTFINQYKNEAIKL